MSPWFVGRLALADALHDRNVFACAVLTVAAVMLPLLLLLGLKTGLVERLLADLRADPAAVEVRLRGNVALGPDWFAAMRARPDVAFVAPRVRTFGSSVQVGRVEDPIRGHDADLVASGPGDPLLGPAAALVVPGRVVLSERLARDSGYAPGDELLVWSLRRRPGGGAKRIEARVTVAAIAPATAGNARLLFGVTELAGMLEDGAEREGDPDAPGRRRFAGFRLYAKCPSGNILNRWSHL
jgi:putative ABC transport system permease protein